jgi:hypothetical protein
VNTDALISALDRFGRLLPAVVADLPAAEAAWRPPDGAWSIVEIVQHLADEEVEDFGARLRSTVTDPAAAWTPIDPEGRARERREAGVSLDGALEAFTTARRASVAWLRSREGTDWSSAHVHPKFGPMRAGDLLAAWAAHDTLHLRQISKRLFQLAGAHAGEFDTRYAGDWTI